MKAVMTNPPIVYNQQRTYKRQLNLHITLLITSIVTIITRAFINVPENVTWAPDIMFQALLMIVFASFTSVVIELLYALSEGKSDEFRHYSRWIDPINTGLLIALLLPITTPLYLLFITTIIGVYIGKLVFGGYGYYIFQPALVGVLFIQLSFPQIYDSLQTPLLKLKTVFLNASSEQFDFFQLFLGNYEAVAIGSTSVITLSILLLYLIITRVIDWKLSLSYLLTMTILSLLIGYINFGVRTFAYTAVNLMTGLTMFAAVFLVPESISSPTTRETKIIYATLIAIFTLMVRTVGSAFEGIVFAVLLGNMVTPFLNRTFTRSNKKMLIYTIVLCLVIVLILGTLFGFIVQFRLSELYETLIGGVLL
jgi:electron transport complex protein RnfD